MALAETSFFRRTRARRARKMLNDCLSEEQLQRAVIKHMQLRAASDVFWFHVPNGGKRGSEIEVARFKAMGLVPGVPDLIFVRSGRIFALELKARGNKPTGEQEAVMVRLRNAGAAAAWADNLDDALRHIADWGLFDRRPRLIDVNEGN